MGKEVALESVDFISAYLKDIDASVSKTILYSVPNYQNFIVRNKNTNKKNLIRALFFLQREKKYLKSLYLAYPQGGGLGVTYDYKHHGYYAFFTKNKRAGPLYRYRLNSLGEFSKYIGKRDYFDFRTRPWSNAYQNTKASWTEPYRNYGSGDLTLTKANPVFKEDGRLAYIVAGDIFLDKIDNYLTRLMKNKKTTALITNAAGSIIASSNRVRTNSVDRYEVESAFDHPECIIRCTLRDTQDQYGGIDKISNPVSFESINDSGNIFVGIKRITLSTGLNWYVFSMVPESNYSDYLVHTLRVVLLVACIILISLVVLAYFVSLYVSAPILLLNDKVKKIGEGKWVEQIKLNRNDEIGELADSFNFMSKRLRSTLLNLESLVDERAEDLKDIILKYSTSIEDLEHANATKDRFSQLLHMTSKVHLML